MRTGPQRLTVALGLLLLATLAPGSVFAMAATPWSTTVFAPVPAPGYPAYVFVHTDGNVFAGSYEDPHGAGVPSRVFEWSPQGQLVHSWPVPGQDLADSHGVQVANQTRKGLLVVLESSTSTVRTLNIRTGHWRTIATLPGAVPNYATWGPGGALYVSDYAQGVIWKVSRRGVARQWFVSSVLDGVAGFGTAGLVFRKGSRDLLITQQTTASASTPTQGQLLSLPIRHGGRPGTLQPLWTSQPGDLPDGFGIASSGHIYVALAGLPEQLVELTGSGAELGRFPLLPGSGDNGSPIPFDTPCSATFLGTRLLVANQSAIAGDASHQAILAVDVGETGQAPFLPRRAGFRHH